MKILVVEDESSIAKLLVGALQKSGHLADAIGDGIEAMDRIEVYDYDVILLDLMLPGADGYKICQHIRNLGLNSKILMLTAKDDVDSKIRCLNLGADDYMTKPFSFEELDARVRALSRREPLAWGRELKAGTVALDLENKTLKANGKTLKTSLMEFRLLEYLFRNKGKICTRTMIGEHVWGENTPVSNVMNVTISKLRKEIKKINKGKDVIETVSKSGYIVY